MLLAIDVGNTHSVFGLRDGDEWLAVWRKATDAQETEDELAAWLRSMFLIGNHPFEVSAVVCASVVPSVNVAISRLAEKWLGVEALFVRAGLQLGIEVRYDPPHAVGADRIANALGALARYEPPIVVVDFGTATTFDSISADGAYVGGAILPGIGIATQALVERTAQLPQIEFKAPERAVGRNTTESLQSGIMLGYAGAIDALAERISEELGGGATVLATGGLGKLFMGICHSLQRYEPNLTLDGLAIAFERLHTP